MTTRVATKVPPFTLEEKRAIVKSLDQRGREHLGFGYARDVWINFALAPLAGGLTRSVQIRFVGGAYWYDVAIDRVEALKLLAEEEGTEDLVATINARYSLDAAPARRSRLRCNYYGLTKRCVNDAEEGWTTCQAHYKHGGPRAVPESVAPVPFPAPAEPEPEPEPEPEFEPMPVVEGEVDEEVLYQELQDQRDYLQRKVWDLERRLQLALKDVSDPSIYFEGDVAEQFNLIPDEDYGPGKTGPCPECGEEMGEQGGEYWHMKERHGKLIHYRLPTTGEDDAPEEA